MQRNSRTDSLLPLTWKHIFASNLKYCYLVTFIVLLVFWKFNIDMLLYLQHRTTSIALFDPVLQLIPAHPVNLALNLSIYITAAVFFIYLLTKPRLLLIAAHALILMWALRWATIYLLPLATPPGKVPLPDMIAYAGHDISRDLFFSGHTATLFIMLFVSKNRLLSWLLLLILLLVVALLLIGHQHYFLDIIAAPFFAYVCYRVSAQMNQQTLSFLSRNRREKAASGSSNETITE